MNDDDGGGESPPQLGRYSLVRRIGKGGMGEVYLGKVSGAHGFEKAVAIKRILPQFSANPHVVNMLVDEARISVLLNHPNVVQVLELGEEDGDYFIVMEYVDGHALSRLMRKLKNSNRRFDPLEACYIAVSILEGLHAAHIQKDHRGRPAGIIHRDVSPQNILVSMDGVVKVIDFGIARARERLEVTQGTSVKGKLRYMAPEQLSPKLIRGKPLDPRADVFAAGIVLWEMLSMRQRFSGENESQIMDQILKEETPDLTRDGLVDRELMNIVDTALEKNRDDRFPDASTFAAKLRGYLYKRDPGFTSERVARKMREAFGSDDPDDAGGSAGRSRRGTARPSSGEQPLHGEGDDEQTRTAFRPETVQRRGRDGDGVEQDARIPGERVVPPAMRARRSRFPAVFMGLLLGAAVVAGGVHLMKGKVPFGGTAAPADAGPAAVVVGELELVVEAEPHTTRISVAGSPDRRFVSPARIKGFTGDTIEIVFDADGYEVQKQRYTFDASALKLKATLVPLPVEIDVRVVPKDATVTVDGAPWRPGMKVTPDRPVEIHAEHSFAKAHSTTAVPRAGETLVVNLVLEALVRDGPRSTKGVLTLTTDPAGAEIFVDSRKHKGVTPTEIALTPGTHRITVRAGANEKTFTLDVAPSARVRRDVALQ